MKMSEIKAFSSHPAKVTDSRKVLQLKMECENAKTLQGNQENVRQRELTLANSAPFAASASSPLLLG